MLEIIENNKKYSISIDYINGWIDLLVISPATETFYSTNDDTSIDSIEFKISEFIVNKSLHALAMERAHTHRVWLSIPLNIQEEFINYVTKYIDNRSFW